MVLSQVQQLLSGMVPHARTTRTTSGCAETDSVCQPVRVFVPGYSNRAERETDNLQEAVKELGLNVSRLGPRELVVSGSYTPSHVSDETVSF